MQHYEVIIIGAGAAGLMCGIEAGKRGRKTLILDHANKIGKKILMSGGGRCNFTNYEIAPERYISHNPHFCKSALSRYTQWDFITLVKKHHIPFHEKTLGQLFCDESSRAIVQMLVTEAEQAGVSIHLHTSIEQVAQRTQGFLIKTSQGLFSADALVIATGGLSIPSMGATAFAYQVAAQFNIPVWPTRAGLVPLTLHTSDKDYLAPLSGVSVPVLAYNERISFKENLLFTHRGLSGPAILQLSSYWHPGEVVHLHFFPDCNWHEHLMHCKKMQATSLLKNILTEKLPKRMTELFFDEDLLSMPIANISDKILNAIADDLTDKQFIPNATEGYRTAEVTLGGVDCDAISSKTMEVKTVPGLYFVGEALDVAGWLGGYNFQWAWSSGWAAGQVV